MKTIYIVKYEIFDYYDYIKEINIFATFDKQKATDYILKAEKVLEKLRDYYENFKSERWKNIKRKRHEKLEDVKFCIQEVNIR